MSWFYDVVYGAKDKRISDLVSQMSSLLDKNAELEKNNSYLHTVNSEQSEKIKKLDEEISDLNTEINSIILKKSIYNINQPNNTTKFDPFTFFTIDGLRVSPSVLLTPQSVELKKAISRAGLNKGTIKETADAVEKWVNSRITYVQDVDNQLHMGQAEEYQNAEYTYLYGKGDCDDFSILFQTIMIMLGFGDRVVGEAGDVSIQGGAPLGHMYNRVLIDDSWVLYDACIIQKEKICNYPKKEDSWFGYSYVGAFKW